MIEPPDMRYAKSGDAYIAFRVVGDGPRDLLLLSGGLASVDGYWGHPSPANFVTRLASFSRLIVMDMRGTGRSDMALELPTFEQQMDDVHAVLDAAGSSTAALFGLSTGGPLAILFAATFPARVSALVVYGTYARLAADDDYPWGRPPGWLDEFGDAMAAAWGTGVSLPLLAPSMIGDAAFEHFYAQQERAIFSPGGFKAFLHMMEATDVRHVLPTLSLPTLVLQRADDTFRNPGHARYLADHIPGAQLAELPGRDHFPFVGDADALIGQVEQFLTGSRRAAEVDRVLATVLFTDIVDSTKRAAELGDRRWRELLAEHDDRVAQEVERFRGRVVKGTGDGVLATFDGPARAIRCADAIGRSVATLGLVIRAGLHTGEIELTHDDVRGIAVHIGARVSAMAGAGEILVSSMVKDLVIGSGIEFEERGSHELKGVPGTWSLFAVTSA